MTNTAPGEEEKTTALFTAYAGPLLLCDCGAAVSQVVVMDDPACKMHLCDGCVASLLALESAEPVPD